jgi:hypothetical protein
MKPGVQTLDLRSHFAKGQANVRFSDFQPFAPGAFLRISKKHFMLYGSQRARKSPKTNVI